MVDSWQFAYGSNLLRSQKGERTGAIREARLARLDGYDIAFNKRLADGTGAANIIARPDSVVWGVVYLCNAEALSQMDVHEGISRGHYVRTWIQVDCKEGGLVDAIAYVAGPKFIENGLKPSDAYLERVVSGARSHGLPTEYIEHVIRTAGRSQPKADGRRGPA